MVINRSAVYALYTDGTVGVCTDCEICNYEVFSDKEMEENNAPYDFVGFALRFATIGGGMWGDILELLQANEAGLDEIERIADCIRVYVNAGLLDDSAYGELLSMVSDYDDELCIPLAEKLMG